MRSTRFATFLAAALAAGACQCGDDVVKIAPAVVEVTPLSIDLGTVIVGKAADAPVEVRNTGGQPLVLNTVVIASGSEELSVADYLLSDCDGNVRTDGTTIAPQGCARLRIRFEPKAAHAVEDTVLLATTAPATPTVAIAVKARSIGPGIELCALQADGTAGACADLRNDADARPTLDFGEVRKGTTATRKLRIHDVGQAQLSVTKVSLVPESPGFSLPDASFAPAIEPGGTASVEVAFTPPATGPLAGKLLLESNDPIFPSLEIPLAGVGTAPALRVCIPAADGTIDEAACTKLVDGAPAVPTLTLPPTAIGETGRAVLKVQNIGNAGLVVSAATITAGAPELAATTPGLPGTLAPNASADVEITLSPVAEGALAGTFHVASDDENLPFLDVPLAATRTAPLLRACVLGADGSENPNACTNLRATPPFVPNLDFGHVPWGAPASRTVRVQNAGLAPLYLAPAGLVTQARDLTLAASSSATVAPGAFADLVVTFNPSSDGAVTGELHVRSNDSVVRELVLPVAGFAEAPKLCVTPQNGLDFSSVTIGTTSRLGLTLRNCGQVPFTVRSLAVAPSAPTNGEFAVAFPSVPAALAPNAELAFDVTYTPTAQRTDNATLNVTTDYQTLPVGFRGSGAPQTCSSAPPTANAGPDQSVRPLSTATLDGTRSTFRRGTGLTYAWRLVSQPTNGTSALSSATAAKPSFGAMLAGDYVAELVVRDSFGCQSPPSRTTVHVVPDKRIHVQLTWGNGYGDVDLHYVGPGGDFDYSPGDVYFGNKNPDWGAGNSVYADGNRANDPSLDIDDVWGNGPENVNMNAPFDGIYKVDVHYYCARDCFLFFCSGSYGPATATLKVFIDGVEKYSGTRTLTQRDLWEAANVRVSGGGTRIDVIAVNAPTIKSGLGDACTSDTY